MLQVLAAATAVSKTTLPLGTVTVPEPYGDCSPDIWPSSPHVARKPTVGSSKAHKAKRKAKRMAKKKNRK